jgi:hypothetical protein
VGKVSFRAERRAGRAKRQDLVASTLERLDREIRIAAT